MFMVETLAKTWNIIYWGHLRREGDVDINREKNHFVLNIIIYVRLNYFGSAYMATGKLN